MRGLRFLLTTVLSPSAFHQAQLRHLPHFLDGCRTFKGTCTINGLGKQDRGFGSKIERESGRPLDGQAVWFAMSARRPVTLQT